MIERIYSKNYRAFEDLDLEFSKINLFLGPNNSGKSSILSLINLLSQTLISSDHSVPLLLRGAKEDLGTFRDLIFDHDVNKELIIGVKSKQATIFGLRRTKDPFIEGIIELTFGFRPKRHEIELRKINVISPNYDINMNFEKAKTSNNYYLTYLRDGVITSTNKRKIDYLDHFLPYLQFYGTHSTNNVLREFYSRFVKELKSIEFIGPFREPPQRTYLFSGENPGSVGVRGERAIDIMTMDYLRQTGDEKRNIVNKISDWYKSCEISERLSIKTLSDRHFEVVLSHIGSKSKENIADVGYGCSQVLPILVAGHNLDRGDILIVQEPEIHLHPKAQAELGTFFFDLYKKGIQTFIETHSEHLLLRIQAHIADKESKLDPEDVRIFYVYTEDGKKKIKRIKIKEDGFFEDKWPKGFFPERYIEAKKIAIGSLQPR